ncbi:MAG: hypothetical protein R2715_04880 [Ilumatobacteraceae bacterium]
MLAIHFRKAGRSADVELQAALGTWAVPGAGWVEVVGARVVATAPASGAASISLDGTATIAGKQATVAVAIAEELSFEFRLDHLDTSVLSAAAPGLVPPPSEFPQLALSEIEVDVVPGTGAFHLSATAFETPWTLDIGPAGLAVHDLELAVDRGSADGTISASWSGIVDLGAARLAVAYESPGDLRLSATIPELSLGPVLQDLCGAGSTIGLDLPRRCSE